MRTIGWLLFLLLGIYMSGIDILHWWRTALFLIAYSGSSTSNGFLGASKAFDARDLNINLEGRAYLITGANAGIGKSTALALAERGGIIHMICRNAERAKEAKKDIIAKTQNKNVHIHILDMSIIGDIHRFAHEFANRYKKLDVLVNNAASMSRNRTLTPEGLELNFATNTMGYYTLTTNLLPLLHQSDNGRVVMVSSGGLLMAELGVDELQHDGMPFFRDRVYNQQKRHQLIMAEELAKSHPDIHFSVMNPGWVDTPGLERALPDFYNMLKTKLRTPYQGADTVVWLAASNAARQFDNSLYYMDRKPVKAHLLFAMTKETETDRKMLMAEVQKISDRLKPADL